MFKIDWPCAVGGALLGYYTKGKVEDTKSTFKGIYTGAINTLKESFSNGSSEEQAAGRKVEQMTQQMQQQLNGNPNGH